MSFSYRFEPVSYKHDVKLQMEILEWGSEQDFGNWKIISLGYYWFEREQDYLLFLLKWA